MGTNIFAFIIVLGILIFFHELGHFIIARLFGVGVEKFSLGFGPKLIYKKIGITEYCISAIPLGGFVKMVGEEPNTKIDPEQIPFSFTHKHVLKRILIVAAGPLFNLLLAVVIFFFLFLIYGNFVLKPVIGEVLDTGPAKSSGLKSKDLVVAVNGSDIKTWNEMVDYITISKGQPLVFSVIRDESLLEIKIKPELKSSKNIFGEDINRYIIGVKSSGAVKSIKLGLVDSFKESLVQSYKIIELTFKTIIKLIQGTVSTKTLGGPIMIAEMAGQQAREGIPNLTFFIALLSIHLAIMNFLPIPVLDGGHLLFFTIEAIIGRPVNKKMQEIAQQGGIFLLILLMVWVFYNDIERIFFS